MDFTDDNIANEASAFDKQIIERIKNGHIPDLRRSGICDYFYNNVWRDNHYANMYYGEIIDIVNNNYNKYLKDKAKKDIKILEVGCGPGHITLELSRNGYFVEGIDISNVCIEIAKKTAEDDPYKPNRVHLAYYCRNLFNVKSKYDVVLFVASLHHFIDSGEALNFVRNILNETGLIIVDEPTRNTVKKKNAALLLFIKGLLSSLESYYTMIDINSSLTELEKKIEEIFSEEKYETESGEKIQSINDNESGFEEMYGNLVRYFKELSMQRKYGIFHQLIGGIRHKDKEKEHKIAEFVKKMDILLCITGAIEPTNFTYIGMR